MFGTCVNADDFTIRNDIYFGDSIEIVQEKEVLGFNEEDIADKNDIVNLTTKYGTIAGIDNSNIVYSFENDELTDIVYGIGIAKDNLDENILESDYNTIFDGLVRKYGDPLYNNRKYGELYSNLKEGEYPIVTYAYNYASFVNNYSTITDINYMLDYNEWVVKYDDYNVKIDLTGALCEYDAKMHLSGVYVGYKYFTDEDLENAIQEIEEYEKDIYSNVDDDL